MNVNIKTIFYFNTQFYRMSDKSCAICKKELTEREIRINERGRRRRLTSRRRYLCSKCRQKEYEDYQKSIKDIIEKKD